MLITKTVEASCKNMLVEITDSVKETVVKSGIKHGMATVSTPEADAGILITSFYDTKGHEDIVDDFARIWPSRDNFRFSGSVTEGAAHSKASIAGQAVDFIVEDGVLILGDSQGIFFAEYAEPRTRNYCVKVI